MTTKVTPALAPGADREHCVSVKGGKVHEVTEWDDQGPDYVFPLCRTGSMTNSGTRYRTTVEDLSCANCVANRERRRARQAEEAAAAPAVEEAPAETVEDAPAAELDEWAARIRMAGTWSNADGFQVERAEDGRLSGFTFGVGLPHNTRYGWIAADGTYARALVRTRPEAVAQMGAHVPVEEVAAVPAVEEAPAPEVVKAPVRYVAEFDRVQVAPGHQENRLRIRVKEETVEYFALPHIPGWNAAGFCRAFGWRPVDGELTYVSMGMERGEVVRTDPSETRVAQEALEALRREVVARLTVRLAHGTAEHMQPVFSLGRAYPIGWVYRLGSDDSALYGMVTASGALPVRSVFHARRDAEDRLKRRDPAAPPTNEALYWHVQERGLSQLGRLFYAARTGHLTGLPASLTAAAPVTTAEALNRVWRSHPQAGKFEPLWTEGGRLLGWTFSVGRLHAARYGWVTAAGTVAQGLEDYRSTAVDVLGYADRDDREAAAARLLSARQSEAQEAARRVHPDAHSFTPFHRPGGEPGGWTFRTGHGPRDRYGVVTADAQVSGVGLYEYRPTAVRAFIQAEREAAADQAPAPADATPEGDHEAVTTP